MSALEAVLAVFMAVAEWFGDALPTLVPVFWTETTGGAGQLTFFGVMGVAALAFSVVFLLFGLIVKVLTFRLR